MYIPKNRIQTNLYTEGNEYSIEGTNTFYIGYYYKLYNGKLFTGKNPDDKPNKPLIAYNLSENGFYRGSQSKNQINSIYIDPLSNENLTYIRLKNVSLNPGYSPPQPYLTIPTEQDYKLGEFRRYFCKKRNEFTYLEISISDYNKIINRDSTIDFISWFPFNIPWSLTGDKDKVGQTNKNIVLLQINRNKLYGFDKYLKGDYLKYYKA
jgi:hypothetical protein